MPVEFAIPDTGAAGWETSLHLVANAQEPELAVKYIDLHLDPAIQAQMLKPPYDVIPTSSKVKLEGAITMSLAKTQDDLAKVRGFDWAKLNPQRGALIERFNREIKSERANYRIRLALRSRRCSLRSSSRLWSSSYAVPAWRGGDATWTANYIKFFTDR